jgi:hypothetical protein
MIEQVGQNHWMTAAVTTTFLETDLDGDNGDNGSKRIT